MKKRIKITRPCYFELYLDLHCLFGNEKTSVYYDNGFLRISLVAAAQESVNVSHDGNISMAGVQSNRVKCKHENTLICSERSSYLDLSRSNRYSPICGCLLWPRVMHHPVAVEVFYQSAHQRLRNNCPLAPKLRQIAICKCTGEIFELTMRQMAVSAAHGRVPYLQASWEESMLHLRKTTCYGSAAYAMPTLVLGKRKRDSCRKAAICTAWTFFSAIFACC